MSARIFLAVLTAALTVNGALYAQSLSFSPKDSDPVEVTAPGGLTLEQDSKRVIALGPNATAVQGAVSVSADQLIADYRVTKTGGNEVYRVFATGNVTMKSENETATGQAAVYDFDKAVLVLEGDDINLVSADGSVTSHKTLEYWSNEGVAVAEGKAIATDKNQHKLFGDRLVAFFRDAATPAPGKPAPKKAAPQKNAMPLGQNHGDINYVQGFGNVRMETATQIVRGDRGAYNIDSGMAVLEGAVKLTQGTSQVAGGFAVVNVNGGTSNLYASAAQAKQPGLQENARVRALIAPKTAPPASTPSP